VIKLLLRTRGPILTLREPYHAPKRQEALCDLNIIFGGFVGIDSDSGKINYLSQHPPDKSLVNGRCVEVDVGSRVIMPGFVDCHNHLLWAGSRAHEFFARCMGATYHEIAEAGGGIAYTRQKTLDATEDELLEIGRRHLRAGTIVPTYLGGHLIPPEFAASREDYVDEVIQTLPVIRQEGLAEFCDVFVDPLALTKEEGRRILLAAKEHGFLLKLHADEFGDDGTSAMGVELGATSVDHLAGIGSEAIRKIAESGTIAVLLPATMFFTQTALDAPVRELIDAGAAVALATDLNPGSSLVFDPSFVLTLAGLRLGMACDEAINAHIKNAAFAVGKGYTKGSLAPGMDADIVVLDTGDYRELGYYVGADNVDTVIARGRFLKRDGCLTGTLAGDAVMD